jgi:hypothetical protein
MLDPGVEARPWEEQLALDDVSYREQLAYLAERSAFYRDIVRGAGGLAEIAQLPLTDKPELRATATPQNPIGAHLCAELSEIVRIYSTSGTTGTPSFVPLTAGDLDNWVTGSARSYAASGIARGQRVVTTYNAGPFVAGAALASFDRIGVTHIPVGTGNSERLIRTIELLRPEAAVLTPSYAAYLVEWAAERDGHGGDGDRRHRRLALGRVRGAERNAPRRARLRPRRADRPRDRGRARAGRRSDRRARPDAPPPPRGAAAPLPHARPRPDVDEHLRLRPHEPARPLPRAHRRHADRARRQRLPLGRP